MTVGRHEVQHVVNDKRAGALPVVKLDGVEMSQGVTIELSAYHSQVASDPLTPHCTYQYLLKMAWKSDRSFESYVSAIPSRGARLLLGIEDEPWRSPIRRVVRTLLVGPVHLDDGLAVGHELLE
jgi:hypothetical protein